MEDVHAKYNEVRFSSGGGPDWREIGYTIAKHLAARDFDLVDVAEGEDRSMVNPAVVGAGDAEISIDRNVAVRWAMDGKAGFDTEWDNLRGIATIPNLNSYTKGITPVLKADLGIDSYDDLVADGEDLVLKSNHHRTHIHGVAFGQALEAYGSSWDELLSRGCRQITGPDGQVPDLTTGEDVIAAMEAGELHGGWGLPELWKVAETVDLTFLSLDDDAATQLAEQYYHLIVDVRPDVLFEGQEAFTTWGYPGQFIFTREGVSDDLAYAVAEVIDQRSVELSWCQTGQVGVPERDLANMWGVPMHDGARAYYESRGWV